MRSKTQIFGLCVLYVHLEYVPDGHGITYKYQPVVPGDSYPVDDDLVIWLKKDLS